MTTRHSSINRFGRPPTTLRNGKEITRAKGANKERIKNGYHHERPPFGLTYDDSGHYWVPDHDIDEYHAALVCTRFRENGHSWREIVHETSVNKDTARRIYTRREQYQPSNEYGDAVLKERAYM